MGRRVVIHNYVPALSARDAGYPTKEDYERMDREMIADYRKNLARLKDPEKALARTAHQWATGVEEARWVQTAKE